MLQECDFIEENNNIPSKAVEVKNSLPPPKPWKLDQLFRVADCGGNQDDQSETVSKCLNPHSCNLWPSRVWNC